ncbi:hypothetical protein [Pseudoalteromonas sp. NGC95]|uniref:hypothetical protein n=1 Tax=Pseudoalteromonas sp. NGC95 TaxID=2792051 RepID=UPI0018CCF7FD|nr:hypothetical protein [Pseudoalteromonas sp. NGC95]MBH0015944.1 hypothetical protein [Pseudoalteromonas sp. NGC95]
MNIAIILNSIVFVASLLWLSFEPGFEPFIVSITAVLTLIGLSIKPLKVNKRETAVTSQSQVSAKDAVEAHAPTEVDKVASRFRESLELMNVGNSYSPYTVAKLAQLMKLHKIGELERVFNAQEEPSFEFIDHFCSTFGINKDWLIHGQRAPFANPEQTNFDPLEYYSQIDKENPNRIYFIMNDSEVGEVFILLELSDFKYKIFQRTWHVSSHVGSGGRSQIYGLYKLICKLKKNDFGLKCGGRILESDAFEKLRSGKVFPDSALTRPTHENPWWDDFTDIYGKYPISTNYEEWYGKGFIYAQSVVRGKLKEESSNKSMLQAAD